MNQERKRLRLSMSSRGLRIWGLLFLMAGMFGRGIVQNVLLNVDSISMEQISELMQIDPNVLKYSTMAVIFQGIETMAVPIFAFLLVEGFRHTSNFKAYITRVLIAAVIAEIPYNLMTTGNIFELTTRNPAFSLVFSLIVMLFFKQYEGNSVKNIMSKCVVVIGALLWMMLLGIQNGIPVVIMVVVLWVFRASRNKQVIFGIVACIFCGFMSPYYYTSALGMVMLLLYTGERGYEINKWVNYLAYPVLLLVVGVAAKFM